MKRMIFDNVNGLATAMVNDTRNNKNSSCAICFYEYATRLIEALIKQGMAIFSIDIHDYDFNLYDREYIVHVYNNEIYCEELYIPEKHMYLSFGDDTVYIHQDCNSKILKSIEYGCIVEFRDKEYDYEDEFNDIFDDDFRCCDCDYCDVEDDTFGTNENVYVSRKKDGTPEGFTKTLSEIKNNTYSSYSYSFYCDDIDILRHKANFLDIDL